jgi:ABC-2 type transport system ATP-binding protein
MLQDGGLPNSARPLALLHHLAQMYAAPRDVDDLASQLGIDRFAGTAVRRLSGGQRQRVALARALIAGSRVLVLDDPMSAVDTETERHLVENLRPAVAGRTVLISGQRLSTVLVADRAIVLRDGKIVEQGLPDDLIRAGGPFAELFGEEALAA